MICIVEDEVQVEALSIPAMNLLLSIESLPQLMKLE